MTRPRIFLPERRLAAWVAQKQLDNQTDIVRRLQRDYGPNSIGLWVAGALWGFIAAILALIGASVLICDHARGKVATAGYSIDAAGVVLAAFGGWRCTQASREGHAFRTGKEPKS